MINRAKFETESIPRVSVHAVGQISDAPALGNRVRAKTVVSETGSRSTLERLA